VVGEDVDEKDKGEGVGVGEGEGAGILKDGRLGAWGGVWGTPLSLLGVPNKFHSYL